MKLILIKKNQIYTCDLPEKPQGQYWVSQLNEQADEERLLSVEGIDDKWVLKSNRNVIIEGPDNKRVKEVPVEPLCFYNIFLKKSNEKALLYSEPFSDDRRYFDKLVLPAQGRLVIGRGESCHIVFDNKFTSSKHAEILINEKEITIKDLGSSNGTFVNGHRVNQKVLKPGDVIYVLGLKIIVGKGLIAINNPDEKVTYDKTIFRKYMGPQIKEMDGEENAEEETNPRNLFYRSPRFKRDVKKAEFKIDPPTPLGDLQETPLALMLGPSITMGLTSMFTGLLTLQNTMRANGDIMYAMPTLVMSFSMMIGTILWPVLTKRYEKKKRIERENIRQEKYLNYLEKVRREIVETCNEQGQILHENNVCIDDCINRIKARKRNLWERTVSHNDFLKVRVGVGTLPLYAEIKYPEKNFSIEDDNLREELYKLAQSPKVLEQVPITLSFVEDNIVGIIGSRSTVTDFVKGIIVQLAALHSYDELKFVFIYDPKEANLWNSVKWLPHVWKTDKTIRFVATNDNEAKELSAFLEKEIANRERITSEDELREITPYYIVFALSENLARKAEMVNSILKHKRNYGFGLVTLYNKLNNLPKECSVVVDVAEHQCKIYNKNDITGQHMIFKSDIFLKQDVEELAVGLANTYLDSSVSRYVLPNMLTFIEMFGVGKIEHLNALTRWQENDPTITLETPIGVDTTGELFRLDLHEKFHGPHGLIAGMTGSGKSEFIMTFILSLAVNYHPHEIAFILIDYKGGGMASAFNKLPHLAGTITNLDGAAVKRSLVSIQSELKRRQAIFGETSKALGISNIDIYKYQKLFRDGVVNEPLQHLFIISDEFAELKTQQPEFMEQLISAARIGRSLGIHLILATQKPSGVVDDQIWSNSKFRICLKVQEKADSMDVIKTPDAAELSVTGRFYVQVGFNELFALGQSAWGGAPYYPSDRLEKQKDDSITIIDNLGRNIKQVRSDKREKTNKNPNKQIDEVTSYLAKLASEENITVRPLWLDPVPAMIYVEELMEKYNTPQAAKGVLNPVIGEIDDPANQRQLVMRLSLTEEGNTVVYGVAGSGKTTFITTLIYSLIKDHTPTELNLYILDFGSETLKAFQDAPHVGDVLISHEAEKINNLFKMLNQEIESRKKLFADYGGDYQSYIRTTNEEIESIVVIVHNYSAFAEMYEAKEETISYLTREGLKYGIYFVVTAMNTGAIRYRILQNFRQLLVLQLNDASDYSGVLGNVDGTYPTKCKGRGIFKSDGVYEFQTAHISRRAENTFDFVRNYCKEYAGKWDKSPAKKTPILPGKIDLEYLARDINHCSPGQIPVGIEKASLNVSYFNFDHYYITLVLAQNNDRADFAQGLAEVLAAKVNGDVIVLDPEQILEQDLSKKYQYVNVELDNSIVGLFNTLVERNNSYKEARDKGLEPPVFGKKTCIINSLVGLMESISSDSQDKLRVFLEKGEAVYNVNFIVIDSVSNIQTVTYEKWFKQKVSSCDGIWIGNGFADQYLLKPSRMTNDLYQEIGEDFGYNIVKGKPKLIKLLSSITSQVEVD